MVFTSHSKGLNLGLQIGLCALFVGHAMPTEAGSFTRTSAGSGSSDGMEERINQVVAFQEDTWDALFDSSYSLGQSVLELSDGLPQDAEVRVETNSDGVEYTVDFYGVGEDPALDELGELTDEERNNAEMLQFELIDVYGELSSQNESGQPFNGLGFSVTHPVTLEEITLIIPISEDLDEEVYSEFNQVASTTQMRTSGNGPAASRDEPWWKDAPCPKTSDEVCEEGEVLDASCVKKACNTYKKTIRDAAQHYENKVAEYNADLAEDRADCKRARKGGIIRNGLAIVGSIVSYGLGGAADLHARNEAYKTCRDKALTRAKDRAAFQKEIWELKRDGAVTTFKNAVEDCCEEECDASDELSEK